MSGFSIDFDKKKETITVEHDNLLGEVKKEADAKKTVVARGFPVWVELCLGQPASDPDGMKKIVKSAVEEVEKEVETYFRDMVKELVKLQEAEKKGDKKAATTGKKVVDTATKELKKWGGEFGAYIRKAVEKALKKEGQKPSSKMASISRTVCRKVELRDDAFTGGADDDEEQQLDASFGGFVKSLEKVASGAGEDAKEEAKLRKKLVNTLHGVNAQAAGAARAAKDVLRMAEFAKANPKAVKSVEDAVGNYVDLVGPMGKSLKKAEKPLKSLSKLQDKDKAFADNKALTDALGDAIDAWDTITGLCVEMEDRASNFCKGLFDFDYDKGKQFLQAIKVLEELPTTEDSGAKLASAVETLSKGSKG